MSKPSAPGSRAAAALKGAGVAYAIHSFQSDPAATNAGRDAAAALAVAGERVFRTIIAEVDGEATATVIPVSRELDLAALAATVGAAAAELCPDDQVAELTGYPADAVAPVGHKHPLPTVVDSSALDFKTIYVCGGSRDCDLELAPQDLIALTRARTAPLSGRR